METRKRYAVLALVFVTIIILYSLMMSPEEEPNFKRRVDKMIEQHPAATGKVFAAEKIRTYEETKQSSRQETKQFNENENERKLNFEEKMCEKWGVLTTISSPTEAVRRFLYKPDWCIVVVGDLEKPKVSPIKYLRTQSNTMLTDNSGWSYSFVITKA